MGTNRDLILEAAAQIFSQKGYHAASMQDIAEAVQLQKGSLYHHVSSKQEILVELLDRAMDLLISRMEDLMAQPMPPQQKLHQAITDYLDTMTSHLDLALVLLLEYRSLEPEVRARHVPRRDKFEGLWRILIQEGIDAGAYNPVNPTVTVKAIMGVVNWTLTWYRPDGPLPAREIANQYADLLMKGLVICDED